MTKAPSITESLFRSSAVMTLAVSPFLCRSSGPAKTGKSAAALLDSLDFRGQGDVMSLQELHAELDRRDAGAPDAAAVPA